MNVSAVSGICGNSIAPKAGSSDVTSQISKLEEVERELQQKLKDIQKKSSSENPKVVRQQQMLLQKQIAQVQQQIKQLESQQNSRTSVNQVSDTALVKRDRSEHSLLDTLA